jgi:hypothetical protein
MPKPAVIFRTADQLCGSNASPGEVLREADAVRARIEYLQRSGDLGDAEQAEIRGLTKTLEGLLAHLDDVSVVDRTGVVPGSGDVYWANSNPLTAVDAPTIGGVRGRAMDVLARTEKTDGHLERSALDALARARRRRRDRRDGPLGHRGRPPRLPVGLPQDDAQPGARAVRVDRRRARGVRPGPAAPAGHEPLRHRLVHGAAEPGPRGHPHQPPGRPTPPCGRPSRSAPSPPTPGTA